MCTEIDPSFPSWQETFWTAPEIEISAVFLFFAVKKEREEPKRKIKSKEVLARVVIFPIH